jgi:hypothetical protein
MLLTRVFAEPLDQNSSIPCPIAVIHQSRDDNAPLHGQALFLGRFQDFDVLNMYQLSRAFHPHLESFCQGIFELHEEVMMSNDSAPRSSMILVSSVGSLVS